MIRVGVIGYGYWGPNIVRNLHGLDSTRVEMVCDMSPKALARVRKAYPGISTCSDPTEILTSPAIDAVAVITPVWTHYELAKKALENGKHVFVEKPFTSTAEQAEELIELAARKNLKIMVDHTFLFTGAVRKIRELTESGALGDLYYYDSLRVNLGLFQHDVSVIWDLAPHDLAIMDHLIKGEPEAVVATGESHLNGVEDVAFMTIYFPGNVIAHINVNWLSPVKIRTTHDRRPKEDAGLERSCGRRKNARVRQRRSNYFGRWNSRPAGQLSDGRHVGAAGGAVGSAARGTRLLCRLHPERQDALQ